MLSTDWYPLPVIAVRGIVCTCNTSNYDVINSVQYRYINNSYIILYNIIYYKVSKIYRYIYYKQIRLRHLPRSCQRRKCCHLAVTYEGDLPFIE